MHPDDFESFVALICLVAAVAVLGTWAAVGG